MGGHDNKDVISHQMDELDVEQRRIELRTQELKLREAERASLKKDYDLLLSMGMFKTKRARRRFKKIAWTILS